MSSTESERIAELESRLMYQESAMETLNQTVIEQQAELRLLSERFEVINQRLKAISPSLLADASEETPPPHY